MLVRWAPLNTFAQTLCILYLTDLFPNGNKDFVPAGFSPVFLRTAYDSLWLFPETCKIQLVKALLFTCEFYVLITDVRTSISPSPGSHSYIS